MTGILLNDRSWEDDDGNEMIGLQYSVQAKADVALYRLVRIGGYTERDIEEMSAEFGARLLGADAAHKNAEAESNRRAAPKTPH